jgi:hypothetical protein
MSEEPQKKQTPRVRVFHTGKQYISIVPRRKKGFFYVTLVFPTERAAAAYIEKTVNFYEKKK